MRMNINETLVSDSKEDEYMNYEIRCISNLDYKINVDLSNFYGGMHVEFLN